MKKSLTLSTVALAALLSACASTRSIPPALDQARTVVHTAERDPQVLDHAALELKKATDALRRAEDLNAKGEPVPDLAESFEPSDEAKKWVFKVRKGATFHDGKNVTADDVVASYRHHMGEDSKSAAKSILTAITDLKADGNEIAIESIELAHDGLSIQNE